MRLILILSSLILSLPVAIVAFYLGNFGLLIALCGYVTVSSMILFIDTLRIGGSDDDLGRG